MLRPIAADLWTLDVPFRLRLFDIGMRTTIVRAPSGEVALISPVQFDPAQAAAIRAIGPVKWIIAPNLQHYIFAPKAQALFPGSTLIGPPGLREKKPKLGVQEVLGQGSSVDFLFQTHLVQGLPKLGEVAMLHRPSHTLILTDLFFNIHRASGFLLRGYLKMADAHQKPAQTSIVRNMITDKAAARASRELLLGWNFDRVIVTHGDVVEADGKAALSMAMAHLG